MSWRDKLNQFEGKVGFRPGVMEEALKQAEAALGEKLPDDLRELYLESDGLYSKEERLDLIWPLAELPKQNRVFRSNEDFRELYMSFDQLLFISLDGGGNQYAYRMLPDPSDGQIYEWDHENDNRTWRASFLEDYCRRRLTGKW